MRRKNKKRTGVGIIAFVVLILCGIVTYKRFGLYEEKENAQLQIDRLNEQLQEQNERAVDIENLRAYVQTKEYIEEIAREKLGLADKDDIIFEPEE